jgi:STE24 endopeptidase
MNGQLFMVVMIYVGIQIFKYWLDYLNIGHNQASGGAVPPEFEGIIGSDVVEKMEVYLFEKTRFGMVTSILSSVAILAFLLTGMLDRYTGWIASMNLRYIVSGWLFFLGLFLAVEMLSIPLNLYFTFKIEKRYGFNVMTHGLWLADFAKSILLSAVLLSALVGAGLWLIAKSADWWWFWFWCFSLAFALFVAYISPYVIEPLFNKFRPVEDLNLRDQIVQLASRAGINVTRVLKMDESRRSTHTNAYFTGIGRAKRIVLFDTLLTSMDTDEILAVLAHEIGHWKRRHLLKGLAVSQLLSLFILFLAHRLIQGDFLASIFDLSTDIVYPKIVIVGFLASMALFLLKPGFNAFTRFMEQEADRFSCDLTGRGEAMIAALVKLSKDNLSNLNPHPLYALFEYSHPPVLQRIRQTEEYCRAKQVK